MTVAVPAAMPGNVALGAQLVVGRSPFPYWLRKTAPGSRGSVGGVSPHTVRPPHWWRRTAPGSRGYVGGMSPRGGASHVNRADNVGGGAIRRPLRQCSGRRKSIALCGGGRATALSLGILGWSSAFPWLSWVVSLHLFGPCRSFSEPSGRRLSGFPRRPRPEHVPD
mgnify:FL=1